MNIVRCKLSDNLLKFLDNIKLNENILGLQQIIRCKNKKF